MQSYACYCFVYKFSLFCSAVVLQLVLQWEVLSVILVAKVFMAEKPLSQTPSQSHLFKEFW